MTLPAAGKRMLVAPAAALALVGCAPAPPQAPLKQAMKLNVATSGISTDCGLAYQLTAFPGDHTSDLGALEVTASASATKLGSVYRRNPAWIYQGDTVSQIVGDGVAMLRACGLRRAAGALSAAASGRASNTAR
jgi:hypothetical protein